MNINPLAAIQQLIDKALAGYCPYGIDDVYVTFSNTEPTARWPGTEWKQITDCFIRAADSSHVVGSTGGSWTHELTLTETPSQGYVLGYGINTTTGNPKEEFPAWSWYFEPGVLKQNTTERTMLAAKPTDFSTAQQLMDITNKYTAMNMYKRTG